MTPEERLKLKRAKAQHKAVAAMQQYQKTSFDPIIIMGRTPMQKEGPLRPGETLLADNHPVHYDYFYVAEYEGIIGKNTFRAVRSDIQGTVWDLKNDLAKLWKRPIGIYRCNLEAR
jgi:hypothetical protein